MRKTVLALACGSLMVPALAMAELENGGAWDVELEAAYLMNRGNSESDSMAGRLNALRDGIKWRHTGRLEAASTSAKDDDTGEKELTAERYFGSYKLDRKLDEKNYLFNIVNYEKDRFSGFHYEASYAIGLGRRFIETSAHTLDLEAGPGYRVQCLEPENSYNFRNCDNKTETATARLAGKYVWKISANATFSEEISTEIGDDNTATRARTSLTSQINDSLALRLSHLLKHNSRVPAGTEKADHEISASLVYSF